MILFHACSNGIGVSLILLSSTNMGEPSSILNLTQCLAHSGNLTNVYWMNGWMNDTVSFVLPERLSSPHFVLERLTSCIRMGSWIQTSLRSFHTTPLSVQCKTETPNSLFVQMGSEPIGSHWAGLMEGALFRTVGIPESGELVNLRVVVQVACGLLYCNPESIIRIDAPNSGSRENVGSQGKD